MAWDFTTEPEFQAQLDWVRTFVAQEVAPLDLLWPEYHHRVLPPYLRKITDPLKQKVKDQGLWAAHLGPDLGGKGFGQVKLSLMNEILAPYMWGPTIFGTQAPDTGNAEVIAHYGNAEQKVKFLQPLLRGEMFSTFAMTEPHAGADPTLFKCRAERDGDEWVINGLKFFSSNADQAAFFLAMVVTNPDVHPYQGISMFLVPRDTPGIIIERGTHYMGAIEEDGAMLHPLLKFDNVRVPAANLLGDEGQGFTIAQTRLSGGRIHHAMRAVGQAKFAFDMMCERALSRYSGDRPIADKQMVQEAIAESYAEIEQFRLFVLRTAWKIDQGKGYTHEIRKEIAIAKVLSAKVMHNVVERAVHIHGALGTSNETKLGAMWMLAPGYGIWDGPTESHVTTASRQILKDYSPSPDLWPREFLPRQVAEARERFASTLAEEQEWKKHNTMNSLVHHLPGMPV
jgi:acyl-CoA dehydrogenase